MSYAAMPEGISLANQRRHFIDGLRRGAAAQHRRSGKVIEPRPAGSFVPLSAEQNHIWLHASMAPDVPLYNEAITIHHHGPLRIDALENALNEILSRHESWRTAFEQRGGRVRAVVHDRVRLQLNLVDLTGLADAERDAVARRIATEDARRPFALSEAPLLRAKILRLATDRHRLHLTLHHLIFDGVSIYRVFMPELIALYAFHVRGEQPSLPEPRLQYGDYAVWHDRQIAGSAMSGELHYWRQKLVGELPKLELPVDRRPPPTPTYRGSMEVFDLSPELTNAIRVMSRHEGVTPYVILLAAFKAMLHRYSGQEDIIVGGLTDTRRHPELHNVMGYFLNGIALRSQPSRGMKFRDYLLQVKATVIEALDASNLPIHLLVREICHRREGGQHPLFRVLFAIQPPVPAYPDGWDITQMDVTVGTAKFDLYLELEEHGDRILGRFLYSSDLFEPATIQRMIGHWTTLLSGAVHDPDCALGLLPLLSEAERELVLITRNTTTQEYPRISLHAWFEAQARQTPDSVAVECGSRTLRYCELSRRVDQLAGQLRGAGVGRGTLVAIAMKRSCDMVAGLLAILKIGGTYLPLDPGLPEARLAFLIEDARPLIVLTDQSAVAKLRRLEVRILLSETAERDVIPLDSLIDETNPEDPAYLLYTSGSTARPKAVEIRHCSVVNLLAAVRRDIGFGAGDCLLAVTTLSFDIAALEIFLPLVTGGRLVVAEQSDTIDPMRLTTLMSRSRCTTMQATPATWRALIASGWLGDRNLRIICGGEALPGDLAAALVSRAGAVWNMYGPTETTIWSLRHLIRHGEDPVPIGRPLANTRVYILDSNGMPVPDLVVGEMMIAGDGLARCYRNAPELTQQKFTTFPSLAGERVYRTGDLARYRSDGAIEFMGRTDNQVKVRGFRVGLEEVESAIVEHPRVGTAALRATVDASGEASLTAYIAGDGLTEREIPALRHFLRDTLPAYMIPTNYVVLSSLPTTPNGKVDRKRLPEPPIASRVIVVEPRDELEHRLAELWKNLLGLSNVGIEDNFFDLGGHSLLAAILVSQIQAIVQRPVPLVALYRSPTIESLVKRLRSANEEPFSYLVLLRAGVGNPVFIVHGIFGNVLQLRGLAELLQTRRPVYAIQARGADLRQAPHATIAEMAAAYLEAIRSNSADGSLCSCRIFIRRPNRL